MKKARPSKQEGAILKVKSPEEQAELVRKFCLVTGTTTERGAELILHQMMSMQLWNKSVSEGGRMVAAVDFIAEFRPTNPTESLLAVQMFGVHEAALRFLQRATLEQQSFEGTDANVLRATRLMRLFNQQVELMAKLKGKTSQQKVTVEHVHVYQGGQAIVGAVSPGKVDRGEEGVS